MSDLQKHECITKASLGVICTFGCSLTCFRMRRLSGRYPPVGSPTTPEAGDGPLREGVRVFVKLLYRGKKTNRKGSHEDFLAMAFGLELQRGPS